MRKPILAAWCQAGTQAILFLSIVLIIKMAEVSTISLGEATVWIGFFGLLSALTFIDSRSQP